MILYMKSQKKKEILVQNKNDMTLPRHKKKKIE